MDQCKTGIDYFDIPKHKLDSCFFPCFPGTFVRFSWTMYEPRYYDSPPLYSPPYSATSHSFYPPRSVHSLQSQHAPYRYDLPPNSYCAEGRPQHFYHYFSPPGFVKIFQGATALMCFIIFACVASTLVWDTNGFGYGGFGVGSTSGSVTGVGSGYYGGSYGYGGSYMTPLSAKSAMISVAAINFLVSLGFLVGSFSRSRIMRGCRFYLIIFICDIILAVLQVSVACQNMKKEVLIISFYTTRHAWPFFFWSVPGFSWIVCLIWQVCTQLNLRIEAHQERSGSFNLLTPKMSPATSK